MLPTRTQPHEGALLMTGTTISLSDAALGQVHAYLSGAGEDMASVIAQTRTALRHGAVTWSGTLTPATIHGLGAIHALAQEEGAAVTLNHSGLDHRQLAFFADYYRYGPGAAGDSGASLAEIMSAAREVLFAVRQMARPARPAPRSSSGRALIIGAYGGDHVGDTAILGGVLLHLARTFGTTHAEVLSHRPEHTARLVAGLESPVQVEVHDYTPATIARRVPDAALIMIAGGPMMDLPRVLAKHLGTIHLARAMGIPLYIERVGVGPFKRQLSRWAARRIFTRAEHISLRTSGAGLDPTLDGIPYSVGRDPAFDYLDTRTALGRTTRASDSAQQLLDGTEGHRLVGINLRPLRHEWAKGGKDYSRTVDSEFSARLAEAMLRTARASKRPVTFVFFPMNPIEFGKSDLAAAYRLHRLVGNGLDFRVWEADPDIDDVLLLLRRMDAVIAMRFHAAIFSLSQGIPTFGIDYYPNQGGKVEQLFADLGKPGDAIQIDKFTPDWLVDKLATLDRLQEAMEFES